jgi:polyhydroxyalkanoate synthesis repressor PhaR
MNRPDPIVIRKVANRRLYVPGAGCFVTLNDIAAMVRNGDDVVVYNDKTGENITHAILTQIIVEYEKTQETLLPITFLRQIIRWHGDEMQSLIGSYLQFSVDAFCHDKEAFLAQPYGKAFDFIEEYSRLNMKLFNRIVTAFLRLPRPPNDDEHS